ncbi:glycosyltransferase family 2 protein [Methanobacterium formicicum]|uniref:Glycosyltransferase family 2 protein n=1 Tax=Methanobacterium formicicum TaxID=2162 RepID=A0A843AHX6_METFO|nr:glycosyltransferase family 2 protein [Methanobacterium formicicum]MBF4474379.1 glycosyltransferase family 2 protein [Methanobacterium formicicum]
MDSPRVSIVIINWNGWEDTSECLESLFQINYPNFDVIIVDNASEDDSLNKIREYCSGNLSVESSFLKYNHKNKPIDLLEYEEEYDSEFHIKDGKTDQRIILIKNRENIGFPGGNNVGIKFALKFFNPNYILLLNNDTIVNKDFLTELIKNGEFREDIGILGPKIYFYDKPNTIWSAGCKISWKLSRGIHIGSNEFDKGQYNAKKEVEYVSGSAFLIKTEVIQRIGLMDEEYFLYFEESDWTLKANHKGYKSLYVPQAKIWHKVSQSGGGIAKPTGLYYITRNRWIFMRKWSNKGDYLIFIIYQCIGAIIFPIFLSAYYANLKLFKAYYSGLLDALQL